MSSHHKDICAVAEMKGQGRRGQLLRFTLLYILLGAITVPATSMQPVQAGEQGGVHISAQGEIVPSSYFGLHIHGMVLPRPYTGKPTSWPDVGFSCWRLWDAAVAWPSLEPKKGDWHFETLDQYVAAADMHHVQVLLPLGLSPLWASSRPNEKSAYGLGFAAEPKDLADWRDYVRTVATRYKGHIHDFEIWNEPNSKQFYTGDVDHMVLLTKEANKILKEIDSSNRLISPAATEFSGVLWLQEFLKKGGGSYTDVIGYHFYVMPQPPEAMVPLIKQVKDLMAETGNAAKPLWNTETGWKIGGCAGLQTKSASDKGLTDRDAAAYLVRSYVLAWASGVSRFYFYAWDNREMGLLDCDGRTMRDAARAYSEIEKWMVGARATSCDESKTGVWTCALKRNRLVQFVIWNSDRSTNFEIPLAWKVSSVTKLSGERVYLKQRTIEIGPTPQLLQ